jgi:hypothetical protein
MAPPVSERSLRGSELWEVVCGRALPFPHVGFKRANPNDHPRSERVRADRAHGLAGRLKQIKLFERVRVHPFWS